MGAALDLVIGGPCLLYVAAFAALSVLLEVFVRYARYVSVLKWLTLSLFAYVAVALDRAHAVGKVLFHLVVPKLSFGAGLSHGRGGDPGHDDQPLSLLLAGRGGGRGGAGAARTRSPCASRPSRRRAEFHRIRWDTYIGMGFSAVIAMFILWTTAATLNAHGITDIQTSADAAKALQADRRAL